MSKSSHFIESRLFLSELLKHLNLKHSFAGNGWRISSAAEMRDRLEKMLAEFAQLS
jgi:hypothetical protein